MSERDRARAREWARSHADDPVVQARNRASSLRSWRSWKRYTTAGVTPEWFRDQLVGQAGRCAICARVFASSKDTHVDHDHASGQIRGLLCANCNRMLGLVKDDPKILIVAKNYLEASLCRADQTGRP